ncbi:MAG TPA: cyclic nucleotide-binding domain-containing protein [Aggregatilineales bacterium]|nr:cyclic nucleotide-binding domain-containing protein [Aggregatilineales bacterium]
MTTIDLFKHSDDFVTFDAGKTIFQVGDNGDLMYVILEGEVNILIHGTQVTTLKTGDVFGEMALIDNHIRSATAIAKTKTKLVPINQKRFQFLIQQTPYFAIELMSVIADRVRRLDNYIPRTEN